ncbi:hypothetical protein PUMCH_004622 [Australozyma saopauloensis]|uniref:Conserved oligomeric Golgi complex subunit 5 n=1 Tax=Australozyma saopauloensis TaxID=291208 RepID=A0AAX4HFA8_9ASCO|nr:hypothetical protein PUMCH_004622 [[Candida] saopauloensis]
MPPHANTDLTEFEPFLAAKFNAVTTLAHMVQATNVLDDTELDLETAAKKVQFDQLECAKRMDDITAAHHTELISNVCSVETYSDAVLDHIVPLATRIEQAYQRINNEVVRPYDDAVKLQGALKTVHSIMTLLRGASFFLMFVQQLQECEKAYEASDDGKDVLRLARLLKQLSLVHKKEFLALRTGTELTQLAIVRDYEPVIKSKFEAFLVELKLKVSHGLGHHTSFNKKNVVLQQNLLALNELGQDQLFAILKEVIQKSVQISLTLLSRSLQSQRALEVNFSDVNGIATSFISTLLGLLSNCSVASSEQAAANNTLLKTFEQNISESIETFYWQRLAQSYKKNILTTLAKGGPIARNLQNNRNQILEAIASTFASPGREHLTDVVNILNNH